MAYFLTVTIFLFHMIIVLTKFCCMWLWLMQLLADLSTLMPGFNPKVIHMGFVVDSIAG